jgi:hypothetical protein
MSELSFATIRYVAIRDRIRAQDPEIDEQTLADTVEGLTDLNEIIAAVIRSALSDEVLAIALKSRIANMQDRLERLQKRASTRRKLAKEVMVELDLKRLNMPDFTASIRPGTPALVVADETVVPKSYWQMSAPQLNRQELTNDLRRGIAITGVSLTKPEPVLSVRTR